MVAQTALLVALEKHLGAERQQNRSRETTIALNFCPLAEIRANVDVFGQMSMRKYIALVFLGCEQKIMMTVLTIGRIPSLRFLKISIEYKYTRFLISGN